MNVLQRFSSRHAIILGAGVLFVGLGALMSTLTRCHCPAAAPVAIEKWVLQAERDPNCYYGSSWNEGDLLMPRAMHDQPVRFMHQFPFEDGCVWQSVETLTPDGHGGYNYRYDEEPLRCAEGMEPAPACPMDGHVRVLNFQ
jgi:hypothetical protein